jgi:hypothetical protein
MENDIDLYSECPLRTLLPCYSNDAQNAPVAIDALMCVSHGPTELDHVVMRRSVLEVLRCGDCRAVHRPYYGHGRIMYGGLTVYGMPYTIRMFLCFPSDSTVQVCIRLYYG